MLGGNLDKSLKNPDLNKHVFRAALELDSDSVTDVRRPASPMTRVCVNGRSQAVDDWKSRLGRVFGLSDRAQRPTLGQLTGQLVRTYFHDAVRVDPHDSDVACGIRIGYLLGFSPDVLNRAVEVSELEKHRTALRRAIRAGALPSLSLSDAELRAQLAQVKSRRRRMEHELAGFRVDEQYADHQRRADQLSAELRELNDSALALRRRRREIEEVTRAEQPSAPADDANERLSAASTRSSSSTPPSSATAGCSSSPNWSRCKSACAPPRSGSRGSTPNEPRSWNCSTSPWPWTPSARPKPS